MCENGYYKSMRSFMTTIFINIGQLLTFDYHKPYLRLSELDQLKIINDAYMIVTGGVITEIGANKQRPNKLEYKVVDCHNMLVTPGLIDAFTQPIYAGARLDELDTPPSISEAGILATVNATDKSSYEQLTYATEQRLQTLLAHGVTTVSVHTGFGVHPEQELRLLEVLNNVQTKQTIQRVLFAQTTNSLDAKKLLQDYVLILKQNKHLVDAINIKVFDQTFSQETARAFLLQMKDLGLPTSVHADQFQMESAAELAAEVKAKAAMHLNHSSKYGIKKLGASETVACLVPLSAHFKNTKQAPIDMLKESNAIITIATGHNPVTAPSLHFTHVLQLAHRLLRLTPKQVLNAVTINAAFQLGVETGRLFEGAEATFVVWDCPTYDHLFYQQAMNLVEDVYIQGKKI
jgi:imidazolonepropionase